MKYKGFWGSCEVSFEDGILHGKIECINDLVTYEAATPVELEEAFHDSVDDYLETCEMLGKEPDKTMSGSFNIRVGSELHKKLYI
ncbi:type II toxin-antitoxin system HicB family antitoxin, partial [Vibrio cholerae]|nr:type II toxin-antitoxin system HicB family antitoxin [Vibrio cholerae]